MLAVAGCAGDDGPEDDNETDADDDGSAGDPNDDDPSVPQFIEVEDPPDAVYVPTHRESMRMLEPVESGDIAVAPMLSYPHPFWIVAGGDEESVEQEQVDDGSGVHLMLTIWDRETGVVLPVDEGLQVRVYDEDGDEVADSPLSPWTMISQGMGFHFGDNVSLPDDGTYTVELTVPPLSTRTTGDLEGRLEETETVRFEFVYDDEFRDEVVGGVEYFDEEYWGQRDAIEPMHHGDHGGEDESHEHDDDDSGDGDHSEHDGDADQGHGHGIPYSELPEIDAYPGTLLVDPEASEDPEETTDLPESGDARLLVSLLESDHRLADDGSYLLVSPRTPYNRVPLPDMALAATVERDGETVAETPLEQTIDGEFGHHYGAPVSDVRPGDSVTIEIQSPPQVARHQGYETAFLEMPSVELEVPAEH